MKHLQLVVNNMSAMTVALGVTHFLQHSQRRGLMANTVAAYGTDLHQYAAFIDMLQQGDLVAVQCNRHVSRFLDHRDAAGDSPRTQARKLSALRMFFRHAKREGWIGFDPTADERVKFRSARVIAPELDQFHAVIDSIPREGAANLRDRALLRLLLDAGTRISGVLMADIPGVGSESSIDLKRGLLHFVNKGGDAESSPFNEATGRVLEAWLAVRDQLAAPGLQALFIANRGQRLSRGSAHHIIKTRGKAAGVDLHAHLFRHRRVAHVLETCGDKVAQQFAHHASLNTTSAYGTHASTRVRGLIMQHANIDAEQGRAQA